MISLTFDVRDIKVFSDLILRDIRQFKMSFKMSINSRLEAEVDALWSNASSSIDAFSLLQQDKTIRVLFIFPSAACITFVYLELGFKLEILLSRHSVNCKKETSNSSPSK